MPRLGRQRRGIKPLPPCTMTGPRQVNTPWPGPPAPATLGVTLMELPLITPGHGTILAPTAEEIPAFPHPAAPGPSSGRCSTPLLVELLSLNEEMIVQLHLERLSEAGTAGFLTKMIEQHEKAAALLRSQLATHASA